MNNIISELEKISIEDATDVIWCIGHNSHLLSKKNRKTFIQYLSNNIKNSKIVLNAIGYLLHSYFYVMDESEKKLLLQLIIDIPIVPQIIIGEKMELIGILYKGSPNESKTKLFNYVITNSMSCLNDPSSIISICNCFSYMFDEVTIMSKEIIIETLKSIRNKNTYVYIDDSILLTLEGFISRSIV